MEMKHILAVLIVLMLSGCAAEVQEQPEETVTPEVTPPVEEPETIIEESAEGEPEVSGGAEDVQVLRAGFDPEELAVSIGTVVTWKNMDNRVHIVSVIGKDTSPRLEEGHIFEYEFEEAGTYQVMDIIFGFRGTVTVE